MFKVITILLSFFVSCSGGKLEQKTVDCIKIVQDSIQVENLLREVAEANREERRKWDSISQHNTDSLRKVVEHIKQNRNISIPQRIKRIKNLYRSMGVGSVWKLSDIYSYIEGSEYDLLATEIGLLLTDTDIVSYNIDSLFAIIGKNIGIAHSENNRLWVISFLETDGGNANSPINVIAWRDTCNRPQGFVSSYSEDFRHLSGLAYWDEIYKLNDTLYLMLGQSKGFGYSALVVELRPQVINFKYRGFITKNKNWNFHQVFEYGLNGRQIVYNLGYDWDWAIRDVYKYNKETQTINFRNTCRYYMDSKMDTLTIGTLTFNGEYFTEKLKKEKIEN